MGAEAGEEVRHVSRRQCGRSEGKTSASDRPDPYSSPYHLSRTRAERRANGGKLTRQGHRDRKMQLERTIRYDREGHMKAEESKGGMRE